MTDTTVQLSNYTAAVLETAQERAFSLEYLIPAMLGEIGEVHGQIAKAFWHEWDETKFKTELVAEYGDICWMTAMFLHKRNLSGGYDLEAEVRPTSFDPMLGIAHIDHHTREFLHALMIEQGLETEIQIINALDTGSMEAQLITESVNDIATKLEAHSQVVDTALINLWAALDVYAEQTTGSPLQVALDYNSAKLASRKARGVLQGSGDHR